MTCYVCNEDIRDGEEFTTVNYGLWRAHRECMLRAIMGGIGHHLNHEHWCLVEHDPDAGLTVRQSAIAVDQYLADMSHGPR